MTNGDFKFLYKYFAIVYVPALIISFIFEYSVFTRDIIEALNGAIHLAFFASFMSGFTTIWQRKRLSRLVARAVANDLPSKEHVRKNSFMFVVTAFLLHLIFIFAYKLITAQGVFLDAEITFYVPFNILLLVLLTWRHYKKTAKLLNFS